MKLEIESHRQGDGEAGLVAPLSPESHRADDGLLPDFRTEGIGRERSLDEVHQFALILEHATAAKTTSIKMNTLFIENV